jgi:hypothetical protein
MATAQRNAINNGQAIAARSEAVKSLIAAHADEFAKILGAERTKRGLSEMPGGESVASTEEKMARALVRQREAEAEFAQRGVVVDQSRVEALAVKFANERAARKKEKK